MQERTIQLHGAIVGTIWQPGVGMCARHLSTRLERVQARDVSQVRRDLYDMIADVLYRDGDFQSAALSADSWIEITDVKHGAGRRESRTRMIDVTALPSIADLVDQEVYASDFYPD